MNKKQLVNFLAKMCYYGQEHIRNSDAWSHDKDNLINLLQCTSYQVACFLAQNTKLGHKGVEWSVVIEDLAKMPPKPIKKWRSIMANLVEELGGVK